MVKMYFNNQETKEERSRSRFDSQEDKECRTRELNAQREGRETDSDICEDNPKEENKGILVQSCDNGEPRAMKKDTDSDSDRDSEHVSNHRRGRMTSGPRRPATSKAKRLAINSLTHSGVKHSSQQSDPPATRQRKTEKDSMPSLVDDSFEHRDGERPEVIPFKQFPAYTPPRTQPLEHDDRALVFAPIPFGHWESGVSLAIVRSVRGRAESD